MQAESTDLFEERLLFQVNECTIVIDDGVIVATLLLVAGDTSQDVQNGAQLHLSLILI